MYLKRIEEGKAEESKKKDEIKKQRLEEARRQGGKEANILRLKFIQRRNYVSRPLQNENEVDREQLLNAWASFAFSFLYLFLLYKRKKSATLFK